MKRTFIATISICAIAFLTFGSRASGQDKPLEAKPNFTAVWKLNIGKSNFGPMQAPQRRFDKIDHHEPTLRVTSTQVTDAGEDTVSAEFTTDGKENTNTVHGNEAKSRLRWEGPALVIVTVVSMAGAEVTLTDRWTLSTDGKTLTMERHYGGPEGEAKATYVLERQ